MKNWPFNEPIVWKKGGITLFAGFKYLTALLPSSKTFLQKYNVQVDTYP